MLRISTQNLKNRTFCKVRLAKQRKMSQQEAIKLFDSTKVRIVWDDEQEKYFFSIVDCIAVLTDSVDATAYWRKLKQRLKAEGNETVTSCHALKLQVDDGKKRLTDVAASEELFKFVLSLKVGLI